MIEEWVELGPESKRVSDYLCESGHREHPEKLFLRQYHIDSGTS